MGDIPGLFRRLFRFGKPKEAETPVEPKKLEEEKAKAPGEEREPEKEEGPKPRGVKEARSDCDS